MRSGPCAEARTSARSCVRSTSGLARPEPQAAQTRAGCGGARGARLIAADLALVEVEGADRDRPRRDLLDQAAIQRVLLVLGHALERRGPTA